MASLRTPGTRRGNEEEVYEVFESEEDFILLNSIKIVLNLGKMSKGGGFGACQKYWSTFLGLLTTLDFSKVLEERTVSKSLILFQKPT